MYTIAEHKELFFFFFFQPMLSIVLFNVLQMPDSEYTERERSTTMAIMPLCFVITVSNV